MAKNRTAKLFESLEALLDKDVELSQEMERLEPALESEEYFPISDKQGFRSPYVDATKIKSAAWAK